MTIYTGFAWNLNFTKTIFFINNNLKILDLTFAQLLDNPDNIEKFNFWKFYKQINIAPIDMENEGFINSLFKNFW